MKSIYGKVGKPGLKKIDSPTDAQRAPVVLNSSLKNELSGGDARENANLEAIANCSDNAVILRTIEGTIRDIQSRFLYIGRCLFQIRKNIRAEVFNSPHPNGGNYTGREFELEVARRFREEALDKFTLSRTDAVKLMTVAEAFIIEKRLPEHQIPKSYTVAYEVAKLDDEILEQASESGFITPDVTRADVRRIREGQNAGEQGAPEVEDTEAYLEKKILKAERRLIELRRRLEECRATAAQ